MLPYCWVLVDDVDVDVDVFVGLFSLTHFVRNTKALVFEGLV